MKTRLRKLLAYLGLKHRIKYGDLNLPIFRSNEGLNDDSKYIYSTIQQWSVIAEAGGAPAGCKILDFGCGQGRMVNGLMAGGLDFESYLGIDTSYRDIDWCNIYLRYNSKIKFSCVPGHNERYNPSCDIRSNLPSKHGKFDLIIANSVFSHMKVYDVQFYLNEFSRILEDGGHVYLTAFLHDGDMDEKIENDKGPLHRVHFSKEFMTSMIVAAGFRIKKFYERGIDRTGQSVIMLQK